MVTVMTPFSCIKRMRTAGAPAGQNVRSPLGETEAAALCLCGSSSVAASRNTSCCWRKSSNWHPHLFAPIRRCQILGPGQRRSFLRGQKHGTLLVRALQRLQELQNWARLRHDIWQKQARLDDHFLMSALEPLDTSSRERGKVKIDLQCSVRTELRKHPLSSGPLLAA